jgi:hypothetical protein
MNGFYIFLMIVVASLIVTIIIRVVRQMSMEAQEAAIKANDEIIKTNFIKGYMEEAAKISSTSTPTLQIPLPRPQPPTPIPRPEPLKSTPTTTTPTTPVVISSAVASTPIKPSTPPPDNTGRTVGIMLSGMVVDELAREAVRMVITKAGRKTAAKLGYKAAAASLKVASKLFAKLGFSSAAKLAAYGLKAGNAAARLVAAEAAEKATAAALKEGVKQTLKETAKNVLKWLGPFGQVLLAFDLLSLGLDMADAGGYGKMGTLAQYRNIKEQAEIEMQNFDNENGIVKPIFKGPIIDYTAVTVEFTRRMSDPNDPMMKVMNDKMLAKISDDLKNNVIKPEDLDNDDVLTNYSALIDPMVIYNQIIKEMCVQKDGKIVDMVDPLSKYEMTEKSNQKNGKLRSNFVGKSLSFCEIECQKEPLCKAFVHRERKDENDIDTNCWIYSDVTPGVSDPVANTYTKIKDIPENMSVCTYTKEACNKSFSWPMKDNDEYAEFKKIKVNTNADNKIVESEQEMCVSSNSIMRNVCEGNNLPYDQSTGLCKIDQTYCLMKGADWVKDEKTNEYDCAISADQEFTESIFGTTITRGLKQVFDMDQYEKCNPNEIDDGFFCRNTNSCDATKKQEDCLGLCYTKCDAGYHPVGCNICSPDCPKSSGTTIVTDDGITCRTQICKDNEEKSGELCYPKCNTGYYGVGPVCWETCPVDYTDIGLICNKDARKDPCPPGMRDDGTSCWLDTYGNGVGTIPLKKPCPPNMRDDGVSCWLDTYGRGVGYANWFESWDEQLKRCERTEGTKCEFWGAIAYPKCKPGYRPAGCCLCEPNSGPGIYVTLGERQYCPQGQTNILGLCYKNCAPGYHYVGGNLCEPDGGPGIKKTLFDRTHCDNPKATNILGKCTIGKSSYTRTVGTIPETSIALKGPSYGRGVGTPAVTIRAKKRIVPYSTKQNALKMNMNPQPIKEKFETPFNEKYIGIK